MGFPRFRSAPVFQPRWITVPGRNLMTRAFPQARQEVLLQYQRHVFISQPGYQPSALCYSRRHHCPHRSKLLQYSLHGLAKLPSSDSCASRRKKALYSYSVRSTGPGSSADHTYPHAFALSTFPVKRTDFSFLLKIIYLGWDTVSKGRHFSCASSLSSTEISSLLLPLTCKHTAKRPLQTQESPVSIFHKLDVDLVWSDTCFRQRSSISLQLRQHPEHWATRNEQFSVSYLFCTSLEKL